MLQTGFKSSPWVVFAALLAFGAHAEAADYTQGVTVSGPTATIWFKSNVATTWVDVHYQVNGGPQQNLRMTYDNATAQDEQAVTVASGNVLTYSFTYNNGNPAYDTPAFSYTVGSGTPVTTGPICFFADANYGGDSFCASADSSWIGTAWNDRVSSVKVQTGYEVDLYADINYGGAVLKLIANNANLAASGFNDTASSYHVLTAPSTIPTSDTPDFGPNVQVFDPSTPATTIQAAIDNAFNAQYQSPTAQFGAQRYAFLFKPGTYTPNARLGFYTTIEGLGQNADDVKINGSITVDSGWNYGDTANATQNFWRSAENLAVTPTGGTVVWAVSQAAPLRHVHVVGNLHMGPTNQGNGQGYSSGGFIADSKVDGIVSTGSQQQWYTRDSNVGQWYDGVWNSVFSGVVGAPAQAFPSPPYTTLATTPASREKPYLYIDSAGKYHVWVPSLRTNASGATWASGSTPGTSIPMSQFYVAKPSDTAATINAALAAGLNLFFTPGVYSLNQTINVTRANTVVLGLGFPTLQPVGGVNAMTVADVDGVKIAGLLFDAGTTNSAALLSLGSATSGTSHAANPTTVQDVFFRVGGGVAGKATASLVVNSNDAIVDDIWAWRADHGSAATGWTINTGNNGVVVNGARVLATGLFVEHYQQYQVLWNGENGKTIFFQNEMPYDVPSQAAWTSGNGNGWAAYKVGANVQNHEMWGVGSYCFFNIGGTNTNINAARGFEVPNAAGVKVHDALTVSLGGNGTISNVVNNSGGIAQGTATVPVDLISYP